MSSLRLDTSVRVLDLQSRQDSSPKVSTILPLRIDLSETALLPLSNLPRSYHIRLLPRPSRQIYLPPA